MFGSCNFLHRECNFIVGSASYASACTRAYVQCARLAGGAYEREHWIADDLGDGYEQLTIPLGTDPDGEGTVEATLVRRTPPATSKPP